MGRIQWPEACDPSHFCGALLRGAVLDSLGWPSPLDLATKKLEPWSTRYKIEKAEVTGEFVMR